MKKVIHDIFTFPKQSNMRLVISTILSLFLVYEALAQCTTFAGTSPNFTWEFCQGEIVTFTPPADMVNDGNDVFFYTIHLGPDWDSSVYSVISNGIFLSGNNNLIEFEIPYTVSLVIADQQNGGSWIINENDPCLSVTDMGTILFHEKPDLFCAPQGIVCGQPEKHIVCDGSEAGYTYNWVGPNGFNDTTADPIVTELGTYCVTVTSSFGCSSEECLTVELDTIIPLSTINPPDPELCQDTFIINGFSTPPNSFQQTWMTNGGSIVDIFGNFIRASGEGEYCVIHTNLTNNCADTACADVVIWGDPPIANAGLSQILTCAIGDAVQLGGPNTSTGPQFTYEWTCSGCTSGNVIEPVPNPTVVETGFYTLKVTDTTTGCAAYSSTSVLDDINFSYSYSPAICPGDSAIIFAGVFSSNPPYNIYIGANGDTLYEYHNLQPTNVFKIPVPEPTVFEIWATDALGCDTPTVHLMPITFDSIEIDFTIETDGCNPVAITANYSSNYPNPNVVMSWNTGEVGPTITATNTGWYSVTLDSASCFYSDSVYVVVDYSGICSYIEGTVIWDTLENCLLDVGEPVLAGWLVEASNATDTFYGTTDVNGYYNIPVEPEGYTVSLIPPNQLWGACQLNFLVLLPNPDDMATVDFLAFKTPDCPLLTVDISTPFLRRCFDGNIYNISYCNEGTAPAINAYVEIVFDDFLTLDFSSIPSIDLGNNIYQFNIGDLDVGECGSFWTTMTVSCNAVLGETHCTEAHIYPDTLCLPPNAQWSGASLQLEATCTDSVRFKITNSGNASMTVPLGYVVIEDIVMYMQAPPPSIILGAADSYEVTLPANGSTWRLEAEQEPFHPQPSYPVIAMEGCGVNAAGSFSTGFVNLFPLGDPEPYLDIDCTENIGGCDPNGKYAYPVGIGEEHFLEPNKDIEYIIRFQNTGTDTAFNIVIRDTLSPFLDVASVRPGAASHPFEFEVYGPGILKFSFPNIQLPDSTVNEPGSNGYVTYRISQRADVPLGSVIENSAAIYFDFNEPVITNTVFHTIGEDFLDSLNTAASDLPIGHVELRAYPNPSGGDVIFEIRSDQHLQAGLTLYNNFGREVKKGEFVGNKLVFERRGLPAGIYFYSIKANGTNIYSGKIILK